MYVKQLKENTMLSYFKVYKWKYFFFLMEVYLQYLSSQIGVIA